MADDKNTFPFDAATLDALPAPAFAVDASTCVTAWNSAMVEATGVAAAEAIGKKFWSTLFASRRATAVEDALLKAEPSKGRLEFTRGGELMSARAWVRPTLSDGGEPEGAIGVLTLEQSGGAGRSRVELAAAYAAFETPVMICECDFRVAHINRPMARILDRVGDRLAQQWPGLDAKDPRGAVLDQLESGSSSDDGGTAWDVPATTQIEFDDEHFELVLRHVCDEDGSPAAIVVQWRDRGAAQRLKDRTDELQRAVAAGDLTFRASDDGLDARGVESMAAVHALVDTVHQPLAQLSTQLGALARGEIPEPLEHSTDGIFAELADRSNTLRDAMNFVTEALSRIADGDLSFDVDKRGEDDAVMDACARMTDQLNTILQQVSDASERVAAGASEMSSTSEILAANSTRSAASLEEISASMESMSTQTKQNAQNAEEAMRVAHEVRESAGVGDEQMKAMVAAMREIDDAGQSISKIIKVIDDIAFKTNLLALNAAVEAARAGVHGRGFAVVAEEVRNLAARSAKAASETTEMIETSIAKVSQGMQIATSTADALGHIVAGVSRVSDFIANIATASLEQADGIEEVNAGVTQVDGVTQQNTANSEEMAATAKDLASQADLLSDLLARFELRTMAHEPLSPDSLSPDLMEAFEEFMMERGLAPPAANDDARLKAAAGSDVDPAALISLEDDFGRY